MQDNAGQKLKNRTMQDMQDIVVTMSWQCKNFKMFINSFLDITDAGNGVDKILSISQ